MCSQFSSGMGSPPPPSVPKSSVQSTEAHVSQELRQNGAGTQEAPLLDATVAERGAEADAVEGKEVPACPECRSPTRARPAVEPP